MWFSTNIGYGFFLGTYSKKFIKLNEKLKVEKQQFRLFGLVPDIYNKIDLTKDAIRSLTNVYIGFEPKFRNFEDIRAMSDMLTDYIKTSNISVYSNINFFSGIDIERYYLLFENIPANSLEMFLDNEDNFLTLYDDLKI
uniref:Uncharacterized protein n=1 Tax=viral metagenome TaxID=1070528 RepID=A0A6C0KSJ0_9ZZZZ